MKGCILLLQAVDSTKEKDVTSLVRKEIRMRVHDILMTVTGVMDLSIYFRVVTSLLQQQSDRNGTRKVYNITAYNFLFILRLDYLTLMAFFGMLFFVNAGTWAYKCKSQGLLFF